MSDNTSDPDRIERELDSTRSRLSSHLSELQDRLSPGQVLDDLVGYFRGSGGDDFTRNLVDSVRANPLPAAITGVGLAWLMAANPRRGDAGQAATATNRGSVRVSGYGSTGQDRRDYDATMARVSAAELAVTRQPDEADQVFRDRVNDAKGQALGLTRQAQETAVSFSQRVQDALSKATQAGSATMHDVRDQVSGAASGLGSALQSAGQGAGAGLAQGGQAAQRAGSDLISTLSNNPVLLGAMGLAAGALLGALIPQSEQEEAALGGIAGQARDTARTLAQEAMNRGGSVAQTVVQAGQDSAREHGLTGGDGMSVGGLVDAALSGDLAASAKQVAQDTLKATDNATRREVMGEDQNSRKPAPGA